MHLGGFLLALFVLALAAQPAQACSKALLPPWRGSHTLFIGRALHDTLLAGPGMNQLSAGLGHFGRADVGPVFGQLVRVERLERSAATLLRRALRASNSSVVVVPWDYGPDCRPLRWSGSALWLTPAVRGLFIVELRDSAHWVRGRPTFDAYTPEFTPYPYLFGKRAPRRDEATGQLRLTAEELLVLYDVLPDLSEDEAPNVEQLERLREWMRAHPSLVGREPAAEFISDVMTRVEYVRVRGLESPLAGTYRFRIRLARGDTLTLFARTSLKASGAVWSFSADDPPQGLTEPPKAEGYSLVMAVTRTLGESPASFDGQDREGVALAYLSVTERPRLSHRDSSVWKGSADIIRAASRMITEGPLDSLLAQMSGVLSRLEERDPLGTLATFVLDPSGHVRMYWRLREGDRVILSVEGERLSRKHVHYVEP
jgi:hypothetical protein